MFGRALGRLYDWQSNQPPIFFLVTWPAFLTLVILCIIKGVCFNAPYYIIRVLLGYYWCSGCNQWFHVWEEGKAIRDLFGQREYCKTCGTAYWTEYHKNMKRICNEHTH